ncbi:MAG: YfiT family bacillithiol transferase [Gemmatimonadaceae bacterium]|jgi:hypothetical protein
MTIDLAYPIGRFQRPAESTAGERAQRIAQIRDLPAELHGALLGLSEAQLDTPYRPGGWTVRQVVHHLADSHTNALTRLKLALTEENPTIRPYPEKAFADLADARLPLAPSLQMIEGVHARLVAVLEAMTPAQFARPYLHPANGPQIIDGMLALYAWHGRHHVAHITGLRARERW